jgi:hypothetical protein
MLLYGLLVFLEGFSKAFNNILKIFSGRLSDFYNRRKILLF